MWSQEFPETTYQNESVQGDSFLSSLVHLVSRCGQYLLLCKLYFMEQKFLDLFLFFFVASFGQFSTCIVHC